jgi:outer membrane protein assembly factor BamE
MNFFKRLSLLPKIAFVTTTAIFTSSCSVISPYKAPITQGTVINQEAVDTLQAGLTMAQVRQILGPPFGKDNFSPHLWEYVFYTTDESFQPSAIKHLSISFDKESYLQRWEIIDRTQPIVAKDNSFF